MSVNLFSLVLAPYLENQAQATKQSLHKPCQILIIPRESAGVLHHIKGYDHIVIFLLYSG